MYTFEQILEYLLVIFSKILGIFGFEVDDETVSNIESMFDGIMGYEPEV